MSGPLIHNIELSYFYDDLFNIVVQFWWQSRRNFLFLSGNAQFANPISNHLINIAFLVENLANEWMRGCENVMLRICGIVTSCCFFWFWSSSLKIILLYSLKIQFIDFLGKSCLLFFIDLIGKFYFWLFLLDLKRLCTFG